MEMTEYAIILNYENGETSVSYKKCVNIYEAMRFAEDSKRTAAATSATVAAVSGFIGFDDRWDMQDEVSDFQRGYYEGRGSVGYTYVGNKFEYKRPQWYDGESDDYKSGFSSGMASLARC